MEGEAVSILAKLKARDLFSLSSQPGCERRKPGNTSSSTLSSLFSLFSQGEGETDTALERAAGRETERARCEKSELSEISPDWAGEYEDALPPLPDYGDESEHDAWLSGVPIAELSR